MEFGVLGPMWVRGGSDAGELTRPMPRALLALLLCRPNEPVSADSLIDELWSGRAVTSPRRNLQVHVHRLRRALGEERLLFRHGDYVLRVEQGELDRQRFESLVDDGVAAIRARDAPRGVRLLRDALSLWRGEPFAGLTDLRWLQVESQRLAQRRLDAVEHLFTAELELDRHAEIVGELRVLVAENPLRENLHALLMIALSRCGRQAEALAAYRKARDVLVDELGLDPGPRLRQLERDILAGTDPGPGTRTGPDADASGGTDRGTGGPAGPLVPAQLPHVAGLAGRVAELRRLDALVSAGRPVVVTGTAGVGKTALVLHWAAGHRDQYPDGQLYVDLRGYAIEPAQAATTVLAGFLRAFGLPAAELPPAEDGRVALYRSVLADRRVLVVLDNAADATVVRPLLAPSGGSQVVITSRDELRGLSVTDSATTLRLDVLPDQDAVRLVGDVVGAGRVAAEREAVAELVRLCGNLPLALRIAAAHLAGRPRHPIGAFVRELAGGDALDELAVPGDPGATVGAAFDLSYDALAPDARLLFRRVGSFPGQDVTAELAGCLADLDVPHARRLLDRLTAAHLLDERTDGRYRPHDLIRLYGARRSQAEDSDADRAAVADRVLRHYLSVGAEAARLMSGDQNVAAADGVAEAAPDRFGDRDAAVAWLAAEHDNLIAAVDGFSPHPLCWRLVDALHNLLESSGDRAGLRRAAAAGLCGARQAGEPAGEAAMLRTLAIIEVRTGHLGTAMEYAEQALAAAGVARNHRMQGWALDILAYLRGNAGELDIAMDHATRCLAISRDAGQAGGEAVALYRQATLYRHLGEFDLATARADAALALATRNGLVMGQAAANGVLAQVCNDLGDHEAALRHAGAAIEFNRSLGDPGLEALEQASLGQALTALGRLDEAREVLDRALVLVGRSGVVEARLIVLLRLAELDRRRGEPARGRRHATEALTEARWSGYRLFEAEALTVLAELGADLGEPDHDAAREALRLHAAAGRRRWLARTERLAGH